MKKQIIALLGAPCSGKGTQGKFIKEYMKCISAGEILRQTYSIGTPEREILDRGELIDINKVNGIMLQYIKDNDFNIVLDGYPRSIEQASFLLNVQKDHNVDLKIIVLQVKDSNILMSRMKERTYCKQCGDTFNQNTLCCNIQVIKRSDDNKLTFNSRLNVYNKDINKILSLFNNVHIVDAIGNIEHISNEIKNIIKA